MQGLETTSEAETLRNASLISPVFPPLLQHMASNLHPSIYNPLLPGLTLGPQQLF